jgi:hypothetical protein
MISSNLTLRKLLQNQVLETWGAAPEGCDQNTKDRLAIEVLVVENSMF